MRSSAIRHLASARCSPRIAAALFEKTVQVWDLQKREQISEFETVLSFGGKRLALHSSGEFCFAANWEKGRRGGVACYNALTGELEWHRTDLKQTQVLHFSTSTNVLWCIPDQGSTKGLDPSSGETLVELKGLADLFESSFSPCMLLVPRKGDYILRIRDDFRIPRRSFSVRDVAFTRDAVCICEVRGSVLCFELSSGTERWRSEDQWGRLWYRDADRQIYGVRWRKRDGEDIKSLALVNAWSGVGVDICELRSWEDEFCPAMGSVITSHGDVIRVNDGVVLARLSLPETEYPDAVIQKLRRA